MMMTMTEPRPPRASRAAHGGAPAPRKPGAIRRLFVDLFVLSLSALTLGGAFLVIAEVDRAPKAVSLAAPAPAAVANVAPVPGLVAAPRPQRRVVVVRRSRAS